MKTISIRKAIAILSVVALGLGTSCKDRNENGNGNEETEMSRDEVSTEGQDLGTEPDSVTLDTIKNDTEY